MAARVQFVAREGIDEGFLTQIRTWADEVLQRSGLLSPRPYLCITIWKTMEKLQAFFRREKEALGVVTGEETEFLATHDAWRGYPIFSTGDTRSQVSIVKWAILPCLFLAKLISSRETVEKPF